MGEFDLKNEVLSKENLDQNFTKRSRTGDFNESY
jgi:hypothetical protein